MYLYLLYIPLFQIKRKGHGFTKAEKKTHNTIATPVNERWGT
jgi:hypothetical protein